MKKLLICTALLLLAGLSHAQKLRIAVAANAQFVAQKIADAFKAKTGIETELIIGASGKFTAQIEQGAPFDIFLSADMKYPEELYSKGFTAGKPVVYAYGQLVLWSRDKKLKVKSIASLTNPQYHKIAVANPQLAPYGQAAIQALNKLKLADRLKDKIVYGESIAQVNQYLLSGAADAAFTAKAIVLDPSQQNTGTWIPVPQNLYNTIAQGFVILKTSNENLEKAKKFSTFLSGSLSKKILKTYGYK